MQPKASMRSILWIVPIMLIGALYLYFKPESNQEQYIALAKEYIVPDSNKTFEESLHKQCDNPNWTFFETNRGQKVVEFSGDCTLDEETPVNQQFLIDDDDRPSLGALLVNQKQIEDNEKPLYYGKIAANE